MNLRYGDEIIDVPVPADAELLELSTTPKLNTGWRTALREALAALCPDLSRVALLVADKTRRCCYPEVLPVLLDELCAAGMREEDLSVYIAYGSHARQSDELSRVCYGPLYDRLKFVHHDARDSSALEHVGDTSRGTPVFLRKDVASASFRMSVGALSHHYFAGFGGGRKLMMPGLAGLASIYANHSLFVNKEVAADLSDCLEEGCQAGVLSGNPLAEDLYEAADFLPVDLALHGILSSQGVLLDLVPGRSRADFESVCGRYAKMVKVLGAGSYDTVIASCGGYPKDINFIQVHKSLHYAAMLLREGGRLLLLAECCDGIGSQTFMPWFGCGGWAAAHSKLKAQYEGNGGTALATMVKCARFDVSLCSSLESETVRLMGMNPVSVEDVPRWCSSASGRVALLPAAAQVLPV